MESLILARIVGLWGRAFRPFFLALSVYAALLVPWWLGVWTGWLEAPRWLSPVAWHGHEMVFGVVAAAIAGFLLTAAPVWTGRRALAGGPLIALFAAWLLGRLAMVGGGSLPAAAVAALDLAFLPLVALALLRTLWGSGQTRNYGILAIVVALFVANLAFHAGALGRLRVSAGVPLRFAVDLVVVLLVVVTGRITPPFTRNALRARGVDAAVRARPRIQAASVALVSTLAICTVAFGRGTVTGSVAALATTACILRMVGWQGFRTLDEPLLWSLHAASLWVAAGLGLVAASDLGLGIPPGCGLHALAAGAMGTGILAVMTRVGLGHTGRPLLAPRGIPCAYLLLQLGALGRVLTPLLEGEAQRAMLVASGLLWAAAFAVFAAIYAPILVGPRVDGRSG